MNDQELIGAQQSQRSPLEAMLAVRTEVGKVVVGQEGVLSGAIAALLVNGHVLLEGVPGVAKTLLAKSLAAAFDLRFTRLQFTPDLMPSDVIGQQLVAQSPGGGMAFQFRDNKTDDYGTNDRYKDDNDRY